MAFVLGISASLGWTPMGWAMLPVGVMIVGFVAGATAQGRSGRMRTRALEQGPLTRGVVLRADPWLYEPGKRVGRAVVFFVGEDATESIDADALFEHARRTLELATSHASEPWARLVAGSDAFGYEPVPPEIAGCEDGYTADVVVYPDLLTARRLDQARGSVYVIVSPDDRFVEHV